MLGRVMVALLAALAAGCTNLTVLQHVPFMTMSRLASFDLTKIDPTSLRVAARLPEALVPRSEGVKVTMRAGREDERTRYDFVLVEAVEAEEVGSLLGYRKAGYKLWIYRFAPADVARLTQLGARLMAVGNSQSRASIEANVEACRLGELPSGALLSTTLLRTDATGYFVLFDDLDLRAVIPEAELAARVPPCK
jgi:hypothetical protein